MMLVTSISRKTIAQTVPATTINPFEIPSGSLSIRYSIDLGRGNTLQVEMTDKQDIDKFKNIDSLLAVFFKDIIPFKDSLSDELAAKRIDYVTDAAGRKKIRIRSYKPLASSFVIQQGEVAALKSEQDTVNIIGTVSAPAKFGIRKPISNIRYYRLSFFVNDLNGLNNIDTEALSEKMMIFYSSKRWTSDSNGNWYIKNGDKSISSKTAQGTILNSRDYLQSNFGTSIQNYKNNFVPSIHIGLDFVFNNGMNKNYFGFASETHFFFGKEANDKVKTFPNTFLTLSYKHVSNKTTNSDIVQFSPGLSLSYLVGREGEFIDKNTFRLSFGNLNFFSQNVNLEPCFYFDNLFKNNTPGLRLNVVF